VTIASPAYANSLTVGGGSTFQSVTILSSVTLGNGGGKILPNGIVTLNSAPSLPFYSAGLFNASSNLAFVSGSLGGQFYFKNVNFSGAPSKQINGTTTVDGMLIVDIPLGNEGLISIVDGQLLVNGGFTASQSLTISSSNGGKLNIIGSFNYGGGVSNTLTILGTAFFSTLTTNGGKMVLNDNVQIGSALVNAGATISMIGPPTANRIFSDVSGAGTLSVEGGTNTFHTMSNINTVLLSGGVLQADTKQCNIATFTQTGGFITGNAVVSVGTATLTTAVINNTPFTAANLNLNGVSNFNGGTLTVTELCVVAASSQLTLASGTVFYIISTAKVSQSAPLLLVPNGNPTVPPYLRNDGQWTSTSDLTLDIQANGNGRFDFQKGTTITVTGTNFTGNNLLLTSATFKSIDSTIVIQTIDGSDSSIFSQSMPLTVTGRMNIQNYYQQNGNTNVDHGNIANLNITTGTFKVTGTEKMSIGSLLFNGGGFTSTGPTKVVDVMQAHITGIDQKIISSVTLYSRSIIFDCGDKDQCELLYLLASLTTNRGDPTQ